MKTNALTKHETDTAVASPMRTLRPAVDIYETDTNLILEADLPGVHQKALQVEVEDGTLRLSAETEVGDSSRMHWREYGPTRYERRFHLSEEVDADRIEAELKEGVLTLRLPKSEKARPQQIEIKTTH